MKQFFLSLFSIAVMATAANAQQVVFDDAYASGVSFLGFGSTTNNVSIVSGVANSGTSSLKISLAGSGNYSGGKLELAAGINLTSYNALTFYIKASKAATLNLVGFGNSNGGNAYTATIANLPLTTSWQKVIIPIPNAARLGSERGLFQFSEGQDEGAYDIYVDDIQFETVAGIGTPTTTIANETIQGFIGENVSNTNAVSVIYPINGVNTTFSIGRRYLDFVSGDEGIATLTSNGTVINPVGEGTTTLTATLSGNPVAGTITVSVYPASAGPEVPTTDASNVLSLYSDAYTNQTVTTWSLNSTRAAVKDVSVNGNNLKRYAYGTGTTNYSQIQFPAIDVSSFNYLIIDAYTNTSTAFQVKLTNANASVQQYNYDCVVNLGGLPATTWKRFVIPMTAFSANMGITNINQMLITATGGSTIYLDNVVFSKVAALPVKLGQFSVSENANASLLKWNTLSESNLQGFAIERSANSSDWKEISFINGKGNNSASEYAFNDNAPFNGKNFYRLKQTDIDGSFTYSNVLMIDFSSKIAALQFYPNPVRSTLNVTVGNIRSNVSSLRIIGADGRIVKMININSGMSNTTLSVNVSSFAKVYICFN